MQTVLQTASCDTVDVSFWSRTMVNRSQGAVIFQLLDQTPRRSHIRWLMRFTQPCISLFGKTARHHPTANSLRCAPGNVELGAVSNLCRTIRVLQASRLLPNFGSSFVQSAMIIWCGENVEARMHEMRNFSTCKCLSVYLGNCCPHAISFTNTVKSCRHAVVPVPFLHMAATRPPIGHLVIQRPCCALAILSS